MGIFETFKHSYLIRDLMLFLIVQLFVQLEIWSIVSLFNYFCSIVVCSIVELFYWLLWSKFFVQLTFVESVFCSIVLFNWSCSIWSRSTDMEGPLHPQVPLWVHIPIPIRTPIRIRNRARMCTGTTSAWTSPDTATSRSTLHGRRLVHSYS